MKPPDPEKKRTAPGMESGQNSDESAGKVNGQLLPVNSQLDAEALQAALQRTRDFLSYQKRKRAEAQGKCVLPEGRGK